MIINIKGVVDDIIIAHYRATADFERYNKTGKYKIADRADYYAAIQNENFDLIVEFDGSYGEYTVLEGGVHNVTKVKYLGKFDDTDSEYLIEGNFTANYKNSNTNKTIAVSGKYRTFAITVD